MTDLSATLSAADDAPDGPAIAIPGPADPAEGFYGAARTFPQLNPWAAWATAFTALAARLPHAGPDGVLALLDGPAGRGLAGEIGLATAAGIPLDDAAGAAADRLRATLARALGLARPDSRYPGPTWPRPATVLPIAMDGREFQVIRCLGGSAIAIRLHDHAEQVAVVTALAAAERASMGKAP